MGESGPTLYHVRTLGGLSLHEEHPETAPLLRNAKALGVLAYLATIPGRTARRRHIADLFWPEAGRRRGLRSLRQALYYLSKKAGGELVRSDGGRLGLASDRIEVDLWRLDDAVEDGRWGEAVTLYGGPFLDGFEEKAGRELEGWIEAENERIWSGLKAAYHALVAEARREGRPERAARHAREYVQLNPLDENAQVALIRSLQEAGDEVGAFQAFERYRALLREELGVEPGEELQAQLGDLRRELLGAGGSGSGRPPSGPEPRSPEAAGRAGAPHRRGASRGAAERSGRGPARAADRLRWTAAAVLAVAALVLTAWWIGPSGDETRTAWEDVEAHLVSARATEPGSRWDVDIDGGRVSVDPAPVDREGLPAPAGGRTATVERGIRGPDVVIRERDGRRTTVTTSRWDEVPVAWSPDGRRLVFRRRLPEGDAGRMRELAYVFDLGTASIRRLATVDLRNRGRVAWSPTGTHVALSGGEAPGESDVYRVDADGTNLTRLTHRDDRDMEPAWSPDGERLAFVCWRTGTPHLWIVGVDGSGLEQATFGTTRERSPVWVSDHHLVFRSNRGGSWDLWSLDLVSRRTRQLTELGDFESGLLRRRLRRVPDRIVDRVAYPDVPRTVSPGQRFRVEPLPVDRDGSPVNSARRWVRWSPSDTTILRRDSVWVTVRDTGRVDLVASVAGWRTDTVSIASRTLDVVDGLPVTWREDWSDGIGQDRWHVMGTPRPYVTTPEDSRALRSGVGGPAPERAFVSNGDENYASGVASRERVSLDRGATVTFPASLPLERGAPYQTLQVALEADLPPSDARAVRLIRDVLLHVVVTARPPVLRIRASGGSEVLPWPSDLGRWHEYGLQVGADGTLSLVQDDSLYWRSEPGFVETAHDAHLVLGGRSVGIETLVGPVTVYEGERYLLADGPRP